MAIVWINGQIKEDSDAGVSLRDAGLLHGAGVFTTLRAYGGRAFRLGQHLQRLRRSCDALFVPLQHKDDVLKNAVDEVLKRNKLADARLRLTVTRGAARPDALHGIAVAPTAFLTAATLEPYPLEFYERGMTAIVLDEQKANPYDVQAGHKTTNYLSRLSALRAASQRQAGEALWFNVHNFLQSGSISNVFIVEGGALVTPPTQIELRDAGSDAPYARSNALPGVTRAVVMELAREAGIDVVTEAIDINRLLAANEIFLTNSIMGVMPVCRLERKAVGDEKPGPVTLALSRAYAQQVEQESTA